MIKKEVVSLSKREKEVLQLSAQGHNNELIGTKLFIDINTVKFHKRNIFSKLDVKNITEAITFAQNNGMLSLVSLKIVQLSYLFPYAQHIIFSKECPVFEMATFAAESKSV